MAVMKRPVTSDEEDSKETRDPLAESLTRRMSLVTRHARQALTRRTRHRPHLDPLHAGTPQ